MAVTLDVDVLNNVVPKPDNFTPVVTGSNPARHQSLHTVSVPHINTESGDAKS